MGLENGILVVLISLFVVHRSFVFINRKKEDEKHRIEIQEILAKLSDIQLEPTKITDHVNSFTESRWGELLESIKKPLTKEQEVQLSQLVVTSYDS